MFTILDDKTICLTRGDEASITFDVTQGDGSQYLFSAGDKVRFSVFEKKNCANVLIQKEFTVNEETTEVEIFLSSQDTKVGELISKPVDYWYEIEINPLTAPRTVIGYDEEGAKIFRLYPEAGDKK